MKGGKLNNMISWLYSLRPARFANKQSAFHKKMSLLHGEAESVL